MSVAEARADIIDEGESNYNQEPFISLLNNCIPFLSDQTLSLIIDDIQQYVLQADKNAAKKGEELFKIYPSAKFFLSEFRKDFRAAVHEFQRDGLIVSGKELNSYTKGLCIHNIFQRLTLLLYQRAACYTAGLDIDLITALSTTPYESESLDGETVAILPSSQWLKNLPGAEKVAIFNDQDAIILEQRQLRALRKQLHICGKGALAIYKNDDGIYKTAGLISHEAALTLPRFQFQNRAEWVFAVPTCESDESSKDKRDDRIRYCKGTLMLPILNLQQAYEKKLTSLLAGGKIREQLARIINAANSCKHGAILIVAEESILNSEVARLASYKRGIRLSPSVSLVGNDTILKQFVAVDGAIFLDFEGGCRAFGVILDGVVKSAGNNARGSRYNSTKTYIEWCRAKYCGKTILGVVKSEDGMMDFF